MQLEGNSSLCNRYRILQPSNDNAFLRGYLPQTINQAYQLIKLPHKSIRHYLQYCQNIHDFLSIAEWRFQAPKEVARYLYAKLNKPDLREGGLQIQVFTDHIELLLKDLKQLITSQSLYFLVTCLNGYSQLLRKFKKVSINPQTIGLNSSGECLVWLNRHLDRNYPQYYSSSEEIDVIKTLIDLLKEKGESTCQSILNKIREYAIKHKSSIKDIVCYIDKFAQHHSIRLPTNLKYLLKQSRIILELEEIQGEKTTRMKKRKCSVELSANSHTQSKESFNLGSKLTLIPQEPSSLSRYILSSKNITKRHSCMQNRLFSSKEVEKTENSNGFLLSDFRRKDKKVFSSNHHLGSRQSNSASNSETSRYRMKMLSLAKFPSNPKSEEKVYFHPCDRSRHKTTKSSQVQTISSLIDLEKQLTNRTLNLKIDKKLVGTHNSILSQFSNSAAEDQVVPEEEQQSERSSPEKGNSSNLVTSKNSKKSKKTIENGKDLELSFGNKGCMDSKGSNQGRFENRGRVGVDQVRQSKINIKGSVLDEIEAEFTQQLIFRGNNWTKTVVGLLQSDTKMNTSVVQGSEKNIYLDDIKLEKLDRLKKEMAQSLIPAVELVRRDSNKH